MLISDACSNQQGRAGRCSFENEMCMCHESKQNYILIIAIRVFVFLAILFARFLISELYQKLYLNSLEHY